MHESNRMIVRSVWNEVHGRPLAYLNSPGARLSFELSLPAWFEIKIFKFRRNQIGENGIMAEYMVVRTAGADGAFEAVWKDNEVQAMVVLQGWLKAAIGESRSTVYQDSTARSAAYVAIDGIELANIRS